MRKFSRLETIKESSALIVRGTVVMEPIGRRWINELAGIVSSGDHGCADDIGQVPRLQNPA